MIYIFIFHDVIKDSEIQIKETTLTKRRIGEFIVDEIHQNRFKIEMILSHHKSKS